MNTWQTESRANLGPMSVAENSINASDSSASKHFLVPLEQLAGRTFGWNLKSTIDILHKHIQQIVPD